MDNKPPCPSCKTSEKVVPIYYGKPAKVLIDQAERKECVLGGCAPYPEKWHCFNCSKKFK